MNHPRTPLNGFTTTQVLILILVGLLGSVVLALAAFAFQTASQSQPTATLIAMNGAAGGQTQPPNQTPSPSQRPASQSLPFRLASCAQSGTDFIQGKVTRVINASTLEVEAAGSNLQVSYAGIEIPLEKSQAGAVDPSADPKIRELLEGQPVVLVKDVSNQDSSGRAIRYVFTSSRFINDELVRMGSAIVSANSPDQACAGMLKQAQEQARSERLGIWKLTPVPTRTFMPFVTLDPATQAVCDCSKRYICSDFKTHNQAQACLNLCNDYSSKLDENRDGIACENLP